MLNQLGYYRQCWQLEIHMSKTHRRIIKRATGHKWLRTPRYLSGSARAYGSARHRNVVTEYDDIPIAALKEMKHKIK